MHIPTLVAALNLPLLVCAAVPHRYNSAQSSPSFSHGVTSASITTKHTTSASSRSSHIPTSSGPSLIINAVVEAGDTTATGNWTAATCDKAITDATQDPRNRWIAAGGPDALNDVINAWLNEGPSSNLNFPQFVSHYFEGPDNWNCQDIANIPCSTVVTCDQVNHPAGYLILNSLSSIHQIHHSTYRALGDALNDMQNLVGDFSALFAPQKEDNTLALKLLLDFVVMISAIASSYAWGFAFIEAGLVTKEMAGISKDITNAAVNSFALAATKDSLKSSTNSLGTQNTLSAALGAFFETWESMESDYVKTLFSGSNNTDSLAALKNLIGSGDMLVLPPNLDLSGLTAQAEKILYGQLIPVAWAVSPQKLHPVILRNSGACSKSYDQDLLQYMSPSTIAGGYVCYNDDAFYVVNAQVPPKDGNSPAYSFTGLPGGTHADLNGKAWGGVILEDIVQSSYDAYTLNGYQNGYVMPDVSSIIDGKGTEGDVVFQNGIRTPGFFSLPICDDIASTFRNTVTTGPSGKYWPCAVPEGYNPSGTNLHINYGCVTINSTPQCASGSVNIVDGGIDNTSAMIYAQFDGGDKLDYMVTPGCMLNATWPRSYGDVYFGQDNCLYDSKGSKINDQCCTEKATLSVVNPYYSG